ncbi:MAG: FKBP-type peptidyl-prolyl cis-trans isomerase [Bacteroidales bacterium]|nr:FKBP-type peptidyl-prolyl cis-trans isomerase [Bacteroidales bacterium]
MEITAKKLGVLAYSIRVNDHQGELLEEASAEQPRTMVFGTGRLLGSFEQKLMGLKAGDSFEFTLNPAESFGEYNPDMVMDLPVAAFIVKGEIKPGLLDIGNMIPMMDSEGNPFNGKVISVLGDKVNMDFNHPLAGKSLYTTGQILEVREATHEELNPVAAGCGCGTPNDSCCGGGSHHGHHHDDDHHHHHGDDNCGVCGNAPELQGQGIGSCQCV